MEVLEVRRMFPIDIVDSSPHRRANKLNRRPLPHSSLLYVPGEMVKTISQCHSPARRPWDTS